MKTSWQTKKLGDVCEIINGSTPLRSNKAFWDDGDVSWFTIDDIREQGHIIKYTKQKITKQSLGKSSVRLLPPESILLCCTASVGEYAITKIPLTTNQQFNGLVVKDKKSLDSGFLFYFSSTLKDQLLGLSGKTTIDFIPISRLKGIEISLPLLTEQKQIVKKLDEVFEKVAMAKENAEKNLRNSRDIFNSYLESVLESVKKKAGEKKLGEVSESVEYGTSSKSKKIGKVAVLRIGNVQNGRFDWNNLVYTDDQKEINKYLLKNNDVLFNRTNSPELVGKTAIYKGEMPAIFAGYLIRIHRKKKLLDADYLNYFLNSDLAKEYGKRVVISSVNQANINGQKLKDYLIPLPSLAEQKTIVKKLDALSVETKKLEKIYEQKLADLEELKKSVLQKAFVGEL
jgi:type I restriction enzyme, S subunit